MALKSVSGLKETDCIARLYGLIPVCSAYFRLILGYRSFLLQLRLDPGTSNRNSKTIGLNRIDVYFSFS